MQDTRGETGEERCGDDWVAHVCLLLVFGFDFPDFDLFGSPVQKSEEKANQREHQLLSGASQHYQRGRRIQPRKS